MQNTHISWAWQQWCSLLNQWNSLSFLPAVREGQSFTCSVHFRLSCIGYSLSNFGTCYLVPLFRSTNAHSFEWVWMPTAEYSLGTNKNGYLFQCTDCIQSKADLNKTWYLLWSIVNASEQEWRTGSFMVIKVPSSSVTNNIIRKWWFLCLIKCMLLMISHILLSIQYSWPFKFKFSCLRQSHWTFNW